MPALPAVIPSVASLQASDDVRSTFSPGVAQTNTYGLKTRDVQIGSLTGYGIYLTTNGTYVFICRAGSDQVTRLTMSTPFDLSTAGSAQTLAITDGGEVTNPWNIAFSPDGTRMFINAANRNSIWRYSLSSAWDLTTATRVETYNYFTDTGMNKGATSGGNGLEISADGTKLLFVMSTSTPRYVRQTTLSTPWQMSSRGTWTAYTSLYPASSQPINDIRFSSDGTKFWVGASQNYGKVFNLSQPYDLSSADSGTQVDFEQNSPILGSAPVYSSDGTLVGLFFTNSSTNFLNHNRAHAAFPVDLQNVDTLTWTVESGAQSWVDDNITLSIRVMNSALTTVLAAATSGGAYASIRTINSNADVTLGPTAFAYVNTGATRAQWMGAQIQIQQTYSTSMGADNAAATLDYVALGGVYTAVPVPSTAPTLTVATGGTTATPSWTTVGNATTYEVQRGGVTLQNTADLSFADTGLTENTSYTYRVRGVSAGGAGPWSSEITVTTIPTIRFGLTDPGGAITPADPRYLNIRAAVTSGTGSLVFSLYESSTLVKSWSAPLTTTPATMSREIGTAVANHDNLELRINGVVNNGAQLRVYWAEVQLPGVGAPPVPTGNILSGLGAVSQSVAATFDPPVDPENLQAVQVSEDVMLTWSPATKLPGVTHYDVFRRDGTDTTPFDPATENPIARVPFGTNEYVDSTVDAGAYSYQVFALIEGT